MSTETSKTLRKFWRTIEAIHTVVYFTPEAKSAYNAIGLRGYWSGYFASAANVGPVDANILQVAIGKVGNAQQSLRGWTDDDWAAGHDRLVARGWIDADGTLTAAGLSGREEIEALTDAASNDAISHLQGTPVAESLLGWARPIIKSGVIPFPNATGVPRA